MAVELWLSLVLVCILGALSPGPSLALVVRNTMLGGQRAGLATAISHGFGVALYAAIAVTGIGLVIVQSPTLYSIIQYAGAAFLVYLAVNALRSKGTNIKLDYANTDGEPKVHGWRDGFLIAFLNPKLALFFLALFSQFVDVNATLQQQLIMIATVGGIDTLWYCIVAYGLSRGPVLNRLKQNSVIVDKITGIVLIALAIRVVI
ncbi:LysE family translocator [Thalassotalea mangrovi]|uniref:LysE family translocator n=1 Tax=Thalassotalea mangrovi TaxID=2572245 RepID=A0A4U1B9I4_9GAMM|nr:LysE family translocator [Thalassotalea mangrovi]TKB47132.1 LysE family translocator [Thalassotalea mangrovi]